MRSSRKSGASSSAASGTRWLEGGRRIRRWTREEIYDEMFRVFDFLEVIDPLSDPT